MTMSLSSFALYVGALTLIVAAGPLPHEPLTESMAIAKETERADQLRQRWMADHAGEDSRVLPPPSITSGSIGRAVVDVQKLPDSPSVTVRFKTAYPGLNFLECYFTSPSGQQGVLASYVSYTGPTSGQYTLEYPELLGTYAEAGTYTMQFAAIADRAGNYIRYSGSHLTAIFNTITFTVKNIHSDDTVPNVSAGEIITPSVSLASKRPILLADLTVSDTISGAYFAYIGFVDPNGNEYMAFGELPRPITGKTTLHTGIDFSQYSNITTGTWSIAEVLVEDFAGNTYHTSDAATVSALFGMTTFNVTK